MNYVIYTDGFNELERMLFLELEDLSNVKFVSKNNTFLNHLVQKIFRIHFSFKINNKINLPFKSLWFYRLYRSFENDDNTVYLFTPSWYYPAFFKYIKKRNTNNKIAFYFGDTIASKKKNIKNLNIDYLKKHVDYVGVYNPRDVREYGVDYLPMCYSKFKNIRELPQYDPVDIVFVGAARSRLEIINKAYSSAREAGLKVWFYIVNDNSNSNSGEDIIYSNKALSYREYLGHVLSAKCILEIVDPESEGGTLRFWDAIMYNKRLITNNYSVLQSKYYDDTNIVYTNDFSSAYFKKCRMESELDYKYAGENSPIKFVQYIEKKLEGQE